MGLLMQCYLNMITADPYRALYTEYVMHHHYVHMISEACFSRLSVIECINSLLVAQ